MVRSRVEIDASEVEKLYADRFGDQPAGGEEVYVRHLLVMPNGRAANSAAAACAVAREARSEIAAAGDASFAPVAQRVSDMNPERGGDLGWLHRGDLAPGWGTESIR